VTDCEEEPGRSASLRSSATSICCLRLAGRGRALEVIKGESVDQLVSVAMSRMAAAATSGPNMILPLRGLLAWSGL
jgi:hypothetical protein